MMTNRKTILIVDDEPDVRTYLTALLEDTGFEAVPAADGIEAFTLARSAKPDLVTLDITMPGQSGLQTYKDLKSDPELKAIPVIIITAAERSMESFMQLLDGEPEPEAFLSKPIDTAALLEIAQSLLSRQN